MTKMRILSIHLLACLAWAPYGPARAAGIDGVLPPSSPPQLGPPVVRPAPQTGLVTAVRDDSRQRGRQIEIDGQWLLVLNGRTAIRQRGLPVGADALRAGQSVRYSMASTTAGETALGVVDVP